VPSPYAKARAGNDRAVRTAAFDAMATGEWELVPGLWQDTELLLWKPAGEWFSTLRRGERPHHCLTCVTEPDGALIGLYRPAPNRAIGAGGR
jgi:hypothetical protein